MSGTFTRRVYPLGPEAEALFARYVAFCRATKSPKTVAHLVPNVREWLWHLEARDKGPLTATRADAHDLLALWVGRGLAPASVEVQIGDVRQFCVWLEDEYPDAAPRNPWRGVHGPRLPKRLPVILTQAQVHAMAEALREPTVRGLRDRALFLFMLSTACRIDEALTLPRARLSLETGEGIVFGKFSKERRVYLTSTAVDAMRMWLDIGWPLWTRRSKFLFLGRHGERMPYTAARDMLDRAATKARVGHPVSPHMLRHTAASMLYEGGTGLEELRVILGHEKLDTVKLYVHLSGRRIREAHAAVMEGITADAAATS